MEQQNTKMKKGLIVVVVGLIVVGALVLGVLAFNGKSHSQVSANDTQPPLANDATTTVSTTSATPSYKDGTYTAEGTYYSPAGLKAITVTLSLKDDLITDAVVVAEATDRESKRYQDKFISGFKQYVVGKNISTLSLSKVSGSSLTPAGFNKAVTTIKDQAKA
jgi:uncharacterized protein with FMN-binding domain